MCPLGLQLRIWLAELSCAPRFMVAGMWRGQGVSHLRDYICLYDVTAGAVVGRTWILLVQLEGRWVKSNGSV